MGVFTCSPFLQSSLKVLGEQLKIHSNYRFWLKTIKNQHIGKLRIVYYLPKIKRLPKQIKRVAPHLPAEGCS